MHRGSFVPLEFGNIRQPLLIGHTGVKLPVQPIPGYVLWIGGLPCAAVVLVLNGGLIIQTAADTKYSFLVHIQVVVVCQIVLDTAISFVRILGMNLLHDLRNLFVFQFSGTLFPTDPTIIGGSGHPQYGTRYFYWISVFLVGFLDCLIDTRLPYLTQPRLLSISSNFFNRRFSISSIFSLCFNCSISICACSNSVRGC